MQSSAGRGVVAATGCAGRAQVVVRPPDGRTRAMIPGASSAVARSGDGSRGGPCDRCRAMATSATLCDRPCHRSRPARVACRGRCSAVGRSAAHGPVPAEPPTIATLAVRLDVRAAADARASRSPSACWWWAVRRVDRGASRQPGPALRGRSRSAWACWPSRSRCSPASSATTRRCSPCTWSSTSCWCSSPPRSSPWPPRSPCCCASRRPARAAALDPARPALARRPGRSAFPVVAWIAFAAVMWVEPLLAAVRCRAGGPARPRARARRCSSARRCCSGGRRSPRDPAPWRLRTRAASCTSSSRCPRTRSWPGHPRRGDASSIRTTRRSARP